MHNHLTLEGILPHVAFIDSSEENSTMVGENFQNFTSEIARYAMYYPILSMNLLVNLYGKQ